MKILLMGLGRQGFRILQLLLESGVGNISVFDRSGDALARAVLRFGGQLTVLKGNPLKQAASGTGLSKFDLIVDALPSVASYPLLEAAAKAGIRVVSVSFLKEDFMALDSEAKASGALIVPDCGAAPGLSHLMAGYSVRQLGGAKRVTMKLGAIPQEPEPPFFHSLTWSVEDLMEEYIRPAKIRRKGEIRTVDPFDTVYEEEIKGLRLQSFISDGARSFLTSYPDVPEVEERTLRWYGHMAFMKTIQDSGLLSHEPVQVGDVTISPVSVLASVLERQFGTLSGGGMKDRFVMEILVAGKEGSQTHYYDMPGKVLSDTFGLVNAVAVTAVETALMIREGQISEIGVKPLELLATEPVFSRITEAHRRHGAVVELTETT